MTGSGNNIYDNRTAPVHGNVLAVVHGTDDIKPTSSIVDGLPNC